METKVKGNILDDYMKIIRIISSVVIIVIFSYLIIAEMIYPDERDVVQTDCRLFETQWERVLDNGEKIPIEVPGKVEAAPGEVVTIVTTIPEGIQNGENLCFKTIWQELDIYVDGELRNSYNTEDSRPFGTNSPLRYTFVHLYESDAGKQLTYKFSSYSKYAGDIRAGYIGDRASIWTYFLKQSAPRITIAFFLLILSFACICVCKILEFAYKKKLALGYLAWTILFCALWMLSEIEIRQIIFRNVSVFSGITYWSLMLIPITLIFYINETQNGTYKKVYFGPLCYAVIILFLTTILQIFDIAQFVDMLIFIHFGLALTIISIIVTITIDTFKKKSDNLFVSIGVYGMLFSTILELALYYINVDVTLGSLLGFGLLFLLVMATIKTGTELFDAEKKRQQAITAREAQAKFLANMSHEIRTPINAIIGMNEMILRECESPQITDYAHNVQSASNMLLGLVNDVLDFSKIESGKLELVENTYSFAQMIQDEVLLLNTRAAGKPISINVDIDKNIPSKLFGDELRIKQILTNLLSNAVKYTKEGTVTFKVIFRWIDEENILLTFYIIDTGIGIREEDLSKLFSSFKRLELNKNRTIQGTGLGLNIAKQLATLMNGDINVKSEYGKGSTFTAYIPQKVIDKTVIGDYEEYLKKHRNENSAPVKVFTAADANVLIVDDNVMNLSLVKGLLKRTKINVDVVQSGRECLEITKENKYDIIFMDHMMPDLDGVETLHLLRGDEKNCNKDAIVIALTANAIAGCREKYIEYGFNDYFAKPIQSDKLDELLIQYLPKELLHFETIYKTEIKKESFIVPKETSEKEKSKSLFYIDKQKGISYCMNSEEFYKEVLGDYCSQALEYVPQLEECVKNADWKQYGIITHAIKSNSMNIGADEFAKLSLKHEMAGKALDETFIKAEYENYIKLLTKLLETIEKLQFMYWISIK